MSTKYDFHQIKKYDEAEMLEGLHEACLSKDPVIAATGRMLKEIMPSVLRAAESEVKHIRSPDDCFVLIQAASAMTRNVFINTLLNFGPVSALVSIIEPVMDDFSEKLKGDFERIAKAHKEEGRDA